MDLFLLRNSIFSAICSDYAGFLIVFIEENKEKNVVIKAFFLNVNLFENYRMNISFWKHIQILNLEKKFKQIKKK